MVRRKPTAKNIEILRSEACLSGRLGCFEEENANVLTKTFDTHEAREFSVIDDTEDYIFHLSEIVVCGVI